MKDYNNSAVVDGVGFSRLSVGVPPPLPCAVPLSVTAVTAVAELAEAAEVPPPLPVGVVSSLADRVEPDFRLCAIRELKAGGGVFNEYDIELATETLRSAYLSELEVSRAKELEFLRTKRESALSFLRAKSAAEAPLRAAEAAESLLRAAAREAEEAAAREAFERKARADERRLTLITIAAAIIFVLLILLSLFLSHGWSFSSLFRVPESWERYL
jgi:hypothetical protein